MTMKVLGVNKTDSPTHYIVEITHYEIEKVYNKTNYNDKMPELVACQEFDIAAGYNFRADILNAIRDMKDAYSSFAKASVAMQAFIEHTKINHE